MWQAFVIVTGLAVMLKYGWTSFMLVAPATSLTVNVTVPDMPDPLPGVTAPIVGGGGGARLTCAVPLEDGAATLVARTVTT